MADLAEAKKTQDLQGNYGSLQEAAANFDVSVDLIEAARAGDLQAVYNALKEGASIHQTSPEGRTALQEVILHKHGARAVKYMLDIRSDIEAKDRLGRTPLHLAIISGDYAVVALLLEAGANIKAADNNGNTVLHFAAAEKNHKILDLLLSKTKQLALNNGEVK
jgi:ankyrin repeat protein